MIERSNKEESKISQLKQRYSVARYDLDIKRFYHIITIASYYMIEVTTESVYILTGSAIIYKYNVWYIYLMQINTIKYQGKIK